MNWDDEHFAGLTSSRTPRPKPILHRTGRGSLGRRDDANQLYLSWFLEDAANSLPYSPKLEEGFHLTLEAEPREMHNLVLRAMPKGFYGQTSLASAFRDFLTPATFDLLRGRLYLEIEYFQREPTGVGAPVAFKIHQLPLDSVMRRRGKYFQTVEAVPETEGRNGGWAKARIDKKHLIVASLPNPWARATARTLRLLEQASSQSLVALDVVGQLGRDVDFDFKTHQALLHNLVLGETRTIGWTGRGLFEDDMLDPQKAWRAIQFARFQTVVRDTVLRSLQKALNRAGAAIGFSSKLELSGVLDSQKLDHLELELEKGTARITELIHPTLDIADTSAP